MIFSSIFRRFLTRNAAPHWLILMMDYVIVVLAGIAAHVLHGSAAQALGDTMPLIGTWCCYAAAMLVAFYWQKTYLGMIRYLSFIDLLRVAAANIIGMAIIAIIKLTTPIDTVLIHVHLLELLTALAIATVVMWAVRIVVRYAYDAMYANAAATRVFIYGVKEGGIALARALSASRMQYAVMGFVSDDEADCGHRLMDVVVYRNDEQLVARMRENKATMLMVSPRKTDDLRNNSAMVDRLTQGGIKLHIYGEQEWDGKSDLRHALLHEVEIEDLLPRSEIEVDIEAIAHVLTGKCVMITGAAGSIGSEIVRQVAEFKPRQLILIDQAETPMHDMRLMMQRTYPHIPCQTIAASVGHRLHMDALMNEYKPEYVFHAAAYKHVPMMEDNPGEAVANNIDGTRIVADLAVKHGVRKFVMVSTDKAVNPTNVMGCSKRICEMYCQSLDRAIKQGVVQGRTEFVTTRFGNVLGSNGSVIPLFREQIRRGGPLTVTHPDIIRYFMLIPEACRLVLQAGTMGSGGEIFVFDMGQPVRIADLAKRMILLSGAEGIEIKYTGLRDGEKLYEELLSNEEHTKPSTHPKIKLAEVREQDYAAVSTAIDQLIETTKTTFDPMAIVAQMKRIVPEFKSNNSRYEVLDK